MERERQRKSYREGETEKELHRRGRDRKKSYIEEGETEKRVTERERQTKTGITVPVTMIGEQKLILRRNVQLLTDFRLQLRKPN